MYANIQQSKELMRIIFWGAVAFAVGQALRRRQWLDRAATYAPLTVGAAAAYLIGCFVGVALLTYFA